MAIVYRITAPSGKKYIGISSRAVHERFDEHLKNSRSKGRGYAIASAIKKYGHNSMVLEVVANTGFEKCKEIEKFLIKHERTRQPFGYNLTDGGDGCPGITVSMETRSKLRAANIGKKPSQETIEKIRIKNTGKKRSAEFCAMIGMIKRGKKASESALVKMRLASKIRAENPIERERLLMIGTNHGPDVLNKIRIANTGKKHSAETRAKMSASHHGKDPEYRKKMGALTKTSWVMRRLKKEAKCPR